MSTVDQRVARGELTRTLILDAARDVLRESGYAGATTRAVADRAGVQLSLVHYHFRGKPRTVLYRKSHVSGWWYAFGRVWD